MQMKKMNLLAIAVAVACVSAAAYAQTANPAPATGKPRIQLDANKDGVIDRAEAAQAPRLAEKFDQLDTDKDGKLSADERRQLRGTGQRGGTGAMHGRMQAADSDGDGRISRAEAQAAEAGGSERFDQMDFNKDGYLDRADAQARAGQRRAECFAKADADRNNQLSRAEFDKMDEVCGQMRGGTAHRLPRNTPNPGPLPPAK
jgi:Ca2+-binding EF-hand superfamily protein